MNDRLEQGLGLPPRSALVREFLIASRFAIVGIVATTVHMVVVFVLVSATATNPLLANLVAFLTAFGVSFTGNYLWTFGAPGSPARTLAKFFLVSSVAVAANTAVLAWLLYLHLVSPAMSAVIAAAVIPAISYLASRAWAFR